MSMGDVDETGEPAVIEFRSVSKWYGQVIGVNNLSLRVTRGVTGLLGPNGAGKSTLLQLATGQLRPSQGEVRVLGHRPWNNAGLGRCFGLCPEQDALFEWMNKTAGEGFSAAGNKLVRPTGAITAIGAFFFWLRRDHLIDGGLNENQATMLVLLSPTGLTLALGLVLLGFIMFRKNRENIDA